MIEPHFGEGQVKLDQTGFFDEPNIFSAFFNFPPESEWPWDKVIDKELSLQVDGVPFDYIRINATLGEPIGGYSFNARGPVDGYRGAPFGGSGGNFTWKR